MEGKNKHIVILGAGESGVGAALLAKKQEWNVFVSDAGKIKADYKKELDNNQIEWEENTHSTDRIFQAELIVKSPGIPEKTDLIRALRNKQVKIISEIEFAGYYTRGKSICVTGSNGKTTTTMLTHHILKKAGWDVGLAGNVGKVLQNKWQKATTIGMCLN